MQLGFQGSLQYVIAQESRSSVKCLVPGPNGKPICEVVAPTIQEAVAGVLREIAQMLVDNPSNFDVTSFIKA